MKANELMLGSYVASDYGCNKSVIYCVDNLSDGYIRGSELDNSSYLCEREEHFDPILITPEILVRLGFKRVFDDVFELRTNGKYFDFRIEGGDEILFSSESLSCDFYLMGDSCKYVHQIQKAMSLVGEKLTMGDL